MIYYLNNATVEHEFSTRGWAMMVQLKMVNLWKCKKSGHGSLQANDGGIEQVFDAVRGQVYPDGALSGRECKCFLLLQVTGSNAYITRLETRQGMLDRGAMMFVIWDFGRNVYRKLYLPGYVCQIWILADQMCFSRSNGRDV
ncbi:hypothetical protein GOP47_0016168 [Adiantum capillus-veneris]|uniref:Uncharacterized protein n=1 Tax=Adiantum capillus-veneris TaxID=13818 RepID=A0A9D4ULU6_ADICA|nr:hypothetical protein GOP47_0016168 [Adiantum capillus-veneris]